MAIADFLVGLVVCPSAVYSGWSMFHYEVPQISYLVVCNVFVDVSVRNMFLLTIDIFFCRGNSTAVSSSCYTQTSQYGHYYLLDLFLYFGIVFCLLQHEYYTIMGTIGNIKIFAILLGISVMLVVIIYRFCAYCMNTNQQLNVR